MSLASDLLPLLAAGDGGITTIVKAAVFVREGERGIKLRFGKAVRDSDGRPVEVDPGWRWLIPYIDKIVRRHVRQQTIRSDNQEIILSDRTVFHVSAVTVFRVTDVYHALFEIDDLDGSVDDLCMAVLRAYLSKRTAEEMANTELMSEEMLDLLQQQAMSWGVTFISFRLTNCSPSHQTAELMLTSQQAERRVAALQSAADVLGLKLGDLDPALGAAIIGVPVATSIGGSNSRRSVTAGTSGSSVVGEYDDYEQESPNLSRDGVVPSRDFEILAYDKGVQRNSSSRRTLRHNIPIIGKIAIL